MLAQESKSHLTSATYNKTSGVVFAFVFAALCPTSILAASTPPDGLTLDRIEKQTLYLKDAEGKALAPIKTSLFELSFLGTLKGSGAIPTYIVLTGKTCENCLEDKQVYLMKTDGSKPMTFAYPGKIFDPKTRKLLTDSRAFFGKCFPGKLDPDGKLKEVYVVFQQERVDRRRHLQPSVFLAEPTESLIREQLIETRRQPKLQSTVRLLKSKQCHEVEGRNRLMLAKPLDLRPRANDDDEEEEEPAKEKEEGQSPKDDGEPGTVPKDIVPTPAPAASS